MKRKLFILMLMTGLLTLNSNVFAGPINSNPKPETVSMKIKAPRGNWVCDVEIKLLIITIKTVYCDRTNDQLCVQKTSKPSGTTQLSAIKSDGTWIDICEGFLIGENISDEEDHGSYTFETEGYIEY
jgi:hypothetical protein